MDTYIIDLTAWSLVITAALLGARACWLFSVKVSPFLAKGIIAALM